MAAADFNTMVQKLYVAYFGRPAETTGLQSATTSLNNAGQSFASTQQFIDAYATNSTVKALMDGFGTSAESTALYGSTAADINAFVNSVYLNVLGRASDVGGLTYWAGEIASGRLTTAKVALAILAAAETTADATVVLNKLTVANNFTTGLDTLAEISGYSGMTAAATARTMLNGVTATTDPATYQATVDTTLTAIASGTAANGTTYTLTTGIDILTGTANNDTFVADAASASSADQLSGGQGTDTFKLFGGAGIADIPTTSSVEVFELVGNTVSTDLSGVTDLTTLILDDATTTNAYVIGGAVKATVKTMLAGESLTLTSTATDTTADLTVSALDALNAGTVTVNFNGAAITTANIASTGATANKLTFATSGNETTINVTGDTAITLVDAAATLATFNASAAKGAVTYDMSSSTVASQTITGGSGNDTLTVDLARNITIDAGAGNDVVVLANPTAANLSSTTGAADSIKGGDGTDVLSLTSAGAVALAGDTAADLAVISGFESLRTSTDLNASSFAISAFGFNSLQIGAATTTAAATVSGFTSGATVELRADNTDSTVAVNIGMTGVTDAGTPSDTLNISLNSEIATADTDVDVLLGVAGINILNVTTADRDATTAATRVAGYDLTLSSDSVVSEINVTGTNFFSYAASATATGVTKVVAASTMTGDMTVNLSAYTATQGATVTGGAGTNLLTGTNMGDIITGGARADTITGGNGTDTLTGGADADTFVFTAGSTGGAPAAATFDTITDFGKSSDIIDRGAAAILTNATASSGVAAISASGIATFNAADTTFAQHITAIEAGINAGGAAAAGQAAVWQESADAYLFISDGVDGVGANDVLIKLTGVTATTLVDGGTTFTIA